ncbi:hypothetical protein FRC04_001150 [Tulasnella sp. 424]|nr:hypothetical protein FRC04_001150 [Tulasnella sp. 424]
MNQISRVATETALSISEMLSLIFSELPPGTQVACACVCKKWSELALDELWRDLQGVQPLLRLVIEDEQFYDEGSWGYPETVDNIFQLLRDADWSRFREYAVRVVSIEFDENMSATSLPSGQGIAVLCFHHRFGNCLTPNVRRIKWRTTSKQCVKLMMPFISERLEELKLEFDQWEAEESFLYLAHRTPSLKKLYIASEESPSNLSTSFSRWVQTCVGLEEVQLPRGWHTSTILAAFGSLPNLFEFGMQWTSPPGDPTEVRTRAIIRKGCFLSLRSLGWSSNITQATDLLQQTSGQLQRLTLDCRGELSQGDIEALLITVAECCPQLDRFCLNLTEIQVIALLTFNIFRPLLACKTLTELRIHYSLPCIVSNSDFEDMGTAWPAMEELVLCPDPDASGSTRGTAISTLSHLATALPRLRVLGLHFDHLEPPGSAGDLLPETQFRCLRELDVGTSQVPKADPTPVGLYLASLFAVGTRPTIHAGVSEVRSTDRSGHSAACVDGWRQVERSVHLTLGVKEAIVRRFSSR